MESILGPWESLCGEQVAQPGTLYVVATPIGNLADLTLRAIRVLETVDAIACETPRITKRLLSALQIKKKSVWVYRDAGEVATAQTLCAYLQSHHSLALVSDAGTPTLSDPGYRLVRLCREKNIAVVPIPGPQAAIAALCVSGLPTHAFLFLGFLPVKLGARTQLLRRYLQFEGTLLLYEPALSLWERLFPYFQPGKLITVLPTAPPMECANRISFRAHSEPFASSAALDVG